MRNSIHMLVFAKYLGLTKLEITSGSGGPTGIVDRSTPGGKEAIFVEVVRFFTDFRTGPKECGADR